MIKKILTFFSLLIIVDVVYGQEIENCKFLSALVYTVSNSRVNAQLNAVFFKKEKKVRKIDFSVNSKVAFIGIWGMEKELAEKKILPEGETNAIKFRDKYSFPSFKSSFLTDLRFKGKDSLYLSFSKPIDNYILIEFTRMNPEIEYVSGPVLKVFLRFNEQGLVTDAFYYGSILR